MNPVIVIQIAAAALAIFIGFQNYNQYKMAGDIPSAMDWGAISIPTIIAFIAPMLKKWFPWLDDILPNPGPNPDPKPISEDRENLIEIITLLVTLLDDATVKKILDTWNKFGLDKIIAIFTKSEPTLVQELEAAQVVNLTNEVKNLRSAMVQMEKQIKYGYVQSSIPSAQEPRNVPTPTANPVL